MIPSNFRIEILPIRALLRAIGSKGLKTKDTNQQHERNIKWSIKMFPKDYYTYKFSLIPLNFHNNEKKNKVTLYLKITYEVHWLSVKGLAFQCSLTSFLARRKITAIKYSVASTIAVAGSA